MKPTQRMSSSSSDPDLTAQRPDLAWRILRSSLLLTIERLMNLVLGVLAGILVVRHLGPEGYGLFSYLGSLVLMVQVFATFGLESIVVRELARGNPVGRVLFSTGLWLKLACGCLGFVVIALFAARAISGSDVRRYLLVYALILLMPDPEYLLATFRARVDPRLPVILGTAISFAITAARLVLVVVGAPLSAFVYITTIGSLVSAVAFLTLVSRRGEFGLPLGFSASAARYLAGESWPLLLSSVCITTYHKIDQAMLFQMAGSHELGVYAAAVRLVEFWYLVPSVWVTSLYPFFSSRERGAASFVSASDTSFRLMTLVAAPLCLFVTAFSSSIVSLLYGARFAGAHVFLVILVWSLFFVFWGYVNNSLLKATGHQRLDLIFTITTAAVNVLLNLALIPRWGGLGAAIVSTVSYGIGPVLGFLFSATRAYSVMMWRSLLSTFVVLLPGAAIIHYAGLSWYWSLPLFGAYTTLAYWLLIERHPAFRPLRIQLKGLIGESSAG